MGVIMTMSRGRAIYVRGFVFSSPPNRPAKLKRVAISRRCHAEPLEGPLVDRTRKESSNDLTLQLLQWGEMQLSRRRRRRRRGGGIAFPCPSLARAGG